MEFAFQKLDVWQLAVDFADKVISTTENLQTPRQHYRLVEQLEAASTSIAMNIAEGKGRYSKKEFVHFLYIARGSLYETITLLTIIQRRGWIDADVMASLSGQADVMARKIAGLINSLKAVPPASRLET
jgi:four helix bundle protein